MKKTAVLMLVIAIGMFSCNESPKKDVKEAKENLTEAKDALKDAQVKESEAAKAKETAEWNSFKNEADSSIMSMEKDLGNLEARIEKANRKDKQKLKAEYVKSKNYVEAMKEKLRQRNLEFETDIQRFDNKVSEKNQSFKREFKHDMNEFVQSFKDFFKDNVK